MDLLSDILARLKLTGTLYFRTSFTSPWSVRVPEFENVSRFHFAHKGRCLVRVAESTEPVLLEQGDLIIITRGAGHTLFCDIATENEAMMLDRIVEESGFTGNGTLVYGEIGSSHETQLVCGHFAFDEYATHPIIDALPSFIHIRNYGEASGSWMENTLRVIGSEAGYERMGSDLIALKLSEILFAQALRTYIESEGQQNPVFAGFSDPRIAKALKAIHGQPSNNWTLEKLAKIAGMSRTSFSTTFANCMMASPLNYITQWRMQLARQQLLETHDSMIAIAETAGYQSEAAFGRVFKKHFLVAPATYRRQHTALHGPDSSDA